MFYNEEKKENGKITKTFRKTAIIVGLLFIIATVTAILSLIFLGSTLETSELLTTVADNETQVIAASIFELILAASLVVIGFMIYPVLKSHKESLALGYFSIRLIETVLIIIGTLSLLSLFTLSQEYPAGFSNFENIGILLIAIRDWSSVIAGLIFFGFGSQILNYQLYMSKLVPRWLSSWGLVGATLITTYGIFGLLGVDTQVASVASLLAAPIAVQEMVFAGWLIVKGFNPSAIPSRSPSQISSYENIDMNI